MVEELKVYVCKYCGQEFGDIRGKGEAENCEKSHLHVADLKLNHIQVPTNDEFCYEPQALWPTFIQIGCTSRAIDGKTYQLVDTVRRRVKPPAGRVDEVGMPPPKPRGEQ